MSHRVWSGSHELTKTLDLAKESAKSIEEADLVHGMVEHFGNDGALWGPLLAPDTNFTSRGLQMPVKLYTNDPEDAALREWFRHSLSEIASGRVSRATRDQIAIGRDRVAQVGKKYLPESPEATIAFVLDLLIDSEKGYGSELRACQLEECDRFFFVSTRPREAGKQRVGTLPKYCSPGHMAKAHNKVKSAWTKARRKQLKQIAASGNIKPIRRHK